MDPKVLKELKRDKKIVYFDMDGVLADFNKGVKDLAKYTKQENLSEEELNDVFLVAKNFTCNLSKHQYGCRVVQQLITVIDSSYIDEIKTETKKKSTTTKKKTTTKK